MEVIYSANARNTATWQARADTVHECAARGAEVIGHSVAGGDGPGLAEGLEVVSATKVLHVCIVYNEVGGEHGGGDFAAIAAVADETIDKAWALGWLWFGDDVRAETILKASGREDGHGDQAQL